MAKDPKSHAWAVLLAAHATLIEKIEAALAEAKLPPLAWYDVLWELQGFQSPKYEGESKEGKVENVKFAEFKLETPGQLSPAEYDSFVRDTVNFLDYIGEPMQLERRNLGIRVLGFLLVLFLLAYFLKQEYWKDIK